MRTHSISFEAVFRCLEKQERKRLIEASTQMGHCSLQLKYENRKEAAHLTG